jgi:plastocyanin
LDGAEKFVSSGWMWPKGLEPAGLPPINNFTVTFEKPGTYEYLCVVHPWMNGVATVK